MKIGDYVRLDRCQGINRIESINMDYVELEQYVADEYGEVTMILRKNDILKSSPNIIDLVEEHDLLKIEYYSLRYEKRVTRLFEVTYKDDKFVNLDNGKCTFMLTNNNFNREDKQLKPIIKSIVTKEQFESMEYKVGKWQMK